MSTNALVRKPALARLWSILGRLVRMELRIYASIARAIARRPAIPSGGSGFTYHKPVLTILIIFIVLSAVEIPILDLIVHQWLPVRIGFLVLGIWGLTWMIGLLCAYLMRPHTVGPGGITVREGLEIDIPMGWDHIASVARRRTVDEPKTPRVTPTDESGILSLRMQDETNVEIELEQPMTITLPGTSPKGGQHGVQCIRIWVDDPNAFMSAVRTHMP